MTNITPEEFEVEVNALMRYVGFSREEAEQEVAEWLREDDEIE